MQVRFHGIFGNAKQDRHFSNSRAEPIVQPQGRLVDFRKRSNAFRKGLITLRRFKQPVRSRLGSDCVIKNRVIGVGDFEAYSRLEVHRLVERDAVDPRAELGLVAKGPDRVMDLEEHFLRHVFGFRNELTAQNGNREAKNESTMAANEFHECLLIAALRACHELGITFHQC